MGIDHVNQPSVVDHRNDHAQVIETLDANLFHWSTPPLKLIEAAKRSAEDKRVFLSEHLLNVGYETTPSLFLPPLLPMATRIPCWEAHLTGWGAECVPWRSPGIPLAFLIR
jgi:hypothetical protein